MATWPKYSSYDLNSSVEAADALLEKGTQGAATSMELARFLTYTGVNNGAFLTRVANAKLFGLIEGTSSQLRVSRRGMDILRPDYDSTEQRARLEAFESVPLYRQFLDKYEGKALPDEVGSRNSLVNDFHISEDKASFVLARLLDSAEQAGLFRVAGDRSRMIRPTLEPKPRSMAPGAPGADGHGDVARGAGNGRDASSVGVHIRGPRTHKIIDGALDLLPAQDWDEAGFSQWLHFFENALRLYYKLPVPTVAATRGGGHEEGLRGG